MYTKCTLEGEHIVWDKWLVVAVWVCSLLNLSMFFIFLFCFCSISVLVLFVGQERSATLESRQVEGNQNTKISVKQESESQLKPRSLCEVCIYRFLQANIGNNKPLYSNIFRRGPFLYVSPLRPSYLHIVQMGASWSLVLINALVCRLKIIHAKSRHR